MQVDPTLQYVIVARLGDFCRFSGGGHSREDLWSYMREKLLELREPISRLKAQQLRAARDSFLRQLAAGPVADEALADFKAFLDGYMAPSDYLDAAVYLDPRSLADPVQRGWAVSALQELRPFSLFDDGEGSPRAVKLVSELERRLGLDECSRILSRPRPSPRRRRAVLRRIRRNVAEYCSVLHIPVSPDDTFSPFLLPRVEALVAACLRILGRFR